MGVRTAYVLHFITTRSGASVCVSVRARASQLLTSEEWRVRSGTHRKIYTASDQAQIAIGRLPTLHTFRILSLTRAHLANMLIRWKSKDKNSNSSSSSKKKRKGREGGNSIVFSSFFFVVFDSFPFASTYRKDNRTKSKWENIHIFSLIAPACIVFEYIIGTSNVYLFIGLKWNGRREWYGKVWKTGTASVWRRIWDIYSQCTCITCHCWWTISIFHSLFIETFHFWFTFESARKCILNMHVSGMDVRDWSHWYCMHAVTIENVRWLRIYRGTARTFSIAS